MTGSYRRLALLTRIGSWMAGLIRCPGGRSGVARTPTSHLMADRATNKRNDRGSGPATSTGLILGYRCNLNFHDLVLAQGCVMKSDPGSLPGSFGFQRVTPTLANISATVLP